VCQGNYHDWFFVPADQISRCVSSCLNSRLGKLSDKDRRHRVQLDIPEVGLILLKLHGELLVYCRGVNMSGLDPAGDIKARKMYRTNISCADDNEKSNADVGRRSQQYSNCNKQLDLRPNSHRWTHLYEKPSRS
jgi:hypothetical protein